MGGGGPKFVARLRSGPDRGVSLANTPQVTPNELVHRAKILCVVFVDSTILKIKDLLNLKPFKE
jgi:hypothetical protein